MVMRTLQENKAEIFRRAQERIQKRRAVRRRVTAIGLSAVCIGVIGAVVLQPPREPMVGAPPKENFQDGSIVCTYVRAEIYAGDEMWTVTDKVAVTKLFEAVFDENGAAADRGNAAAGQSGVPYRIILFNEDGTRVEYMMSELQWQVFGLEMEEGS